MNHLREIVYEFWTAIHFTEMCLRIGGETIPFVSRNGLPEVISEKISLQMLDIN